MIQTANMSRLLGTLICGICFACSAAETSEPSNEPGDGVSGAESGAPPAATAEADAVLQLDVEAGHTLTFYETEDSGLVIVESMGQDQKSVLRNAESTDALEVFQSLRPGADVPARLQAAYDRGQRAVAVGSALEVPAGAVPQFGGGEAAPSGTSQLRAQDGVGAIQQAHSSSSAAHFVNTHDGCAWGSRGSGCRVNWANGFWGSMTPASSMTCLVDHYAGNGVTIQLTVGATVLSFSQAVNTLQTYTAGVVGGQLTRRIDVTNASGDSFHAGCRWTI